MKTLIAALVIGTPVLASSALASEEIYYALSTNETSLVAPRTEIKTGKSVGGLSCVRTNHVVHGTHYACDLNLDEVNYGEIYESLQVEANPLSADRMTLLLEKKAGALTCEKMNRLTEGTSYRCRLAY